MDHARQMEEEGHKIIKLNIGNLAVFGFDAPEEIQQDMIRNLPNSAGYSDSKGIFGARKAVMHEQFFLEVLQETKVMLVQGTGFNWSAPDHFRIVFLPHLDDIRAKITPKTKGIVVINPNNPTGALYSDEILNGIVEIARNHGLVIFADEVYDKVLYDDLKHTPIASLSQDVLTLTFNSLSKSYRSCGYRAGWMIVTGDKRPAQDYIEGLNMLSNMRLCANVPGQWAIQTALGGHQSINELVNEGGRLRKQRDLAYELINAIPGVSCVKPKAALYMFPKLDPKICSSFLKSYKKPKSCWSRVRALIGRRPIISELCFCPIWTICVRPLNAWPSF